MSLVNQMLRDLESRHADSSEKSGLPNEVRPLPALTEDGRQRTPLILIAGVAILGVVSWWWFGRIDSTPDVAPPLAAKAPPALPGSRLKLDADLTTARLRPPVVNIASPSPVVHEPVVVLKTAPSGNAADLPHQLPANGVEKKLPQRDPLQIARSEIEAGRHDAAEAILGQALGSDPSQVAVRQMLIKLQVDRHRNEDALKTLLEGLALHKEQSQWAMNAARLQVDQNDLSGAWSTLERSLPASVNIAEYRAFCGTVLSRLKRHGEAAEHYRAALATNPDEGRWWIGLALALEADGKSAEAREAFSSAKATGKLSPQLSSYVDSKLRQ